MSSFSVNTNYGALVAVDTFRKINDDFASTSKRVQTGLWVADATDDGSTFAVAQGIRSQLAGMGAIKDSLARGTGLADVALAGATNVSNKLADVRQKITQLSDGSLNSSQRAQYTSDLTAMMNQISSFIGNAEFNGTNILKSGATDQTFLATTGGTTMSLKARDLEEAFTTFEGAVDVSDAAAALTSMTAFSTFETAVGNALNNIAGERASLVSQQKFTDTIMDATTKALGYMVDANLAKESAKLTSLQTRQQLAAQAISMANQAPAILLSLFR